MRTKVKLTPEEKDMIWDLAMDCLETSSRHKIRGAFSLKDILLTTSYLMNVYGRTKSGEILTTRKLNEKLESLFVDILEEE